MKFPQCFYTKAFWIVIPLLAASMGSSVLAINEQVTNNYNYDYKQDEKISIINDHINEKLTDIMINQYILCDKLDAKCL